MKAWPFLFGVVLLLAVAGCGGGTKTVTETTTVVQTTTEQVTTQQAPPSATACTGDAMSGSFKVIPGSPGAGQISYRLRLKNDSPVSYPHLEVFHLVPAGFQLVDSSPEARQEGSNVRWIAAAAAGRTLVFTDQVMAGTVEESQHVAPRTRGALSAPPAHQFSSTACARGSATGPALACAMVREQLTDGPDAGGPAPKHWQPGLLGIGLVAALFAACGGLFRKRRDRGGVEEG